MILFHQWPHNSTLLKSERSLGINRGRKCLSLLFLQEIKALQGLDDDESDIEYLVSYWTETLVIG